jgi:hypothetical protein
MQTVSLFGAKSITNTKRCCVECAFCLGDLGRRREVLPEEMR